MREDALKATFFQSRDACELQSHTTWNKSGETAFQFSNFPTCLACSGVKGKAFSPSVVSQNLSVDHLSRLSQIHACLGQFTTVGGFEVLNGGLIIKG